MAYLTYDEYKEFEFAELEETKFDRLLKRASEAVDSVTRHFYRFNKIEDDIPFRREQFKKAIACQIEYFHEVGATTSEGMNSSPQSFQAGRTSVSNSGRHKTGGSVEKKPLVAEEVFMHLSQTGLLYRGIDVR